MVYSSSNNMLGPDINGPVIYVVKEGVVLPGMEERFARAVKQAKETAVYASTHQVTELSA